MAQFKWVSREGTKWAVCDMGDDHISNALMIVDRCLHDNRPWHNRSYYLKARKALKAEQAIRVRLRGTIRVQIGKMLRIKITDARAVSAGIA